MRFTEVLVKNIVLRVVQIQLVEQVVEVGAKFDLRVFANDLEGWKSEGLAERRVHVKVTRAGEYAAMNSREAWKWAKTLLTGGAYRRVRIREKASEQHASGHIRRCEEGRPSAGDRGIAAIVGLEPSEIGGGQDLAIAGIA